MTTALYGIVGEFLEPASVLAAAQAARQQGYYKMDAYTPFSVEGLAEAIGVERNPVARIVLITGILGALTAYTLQTYSAVFDYPLNVGGRPLHSWPAFIPITFELTVLFAALGGLLGMLWLNGLPSPYHPIFNTPHFEERSHSRFYLCIEADNEFFRPAEVRALLDAHHPAAVWEVHK